MPASSFGATPIRIELDPADASSADGDRIARVAVRGVPGGNARVVQVLGVDDRDLAYRLHLTEAEFALLDAQVGTQAVLTAAGDAKGTFLLESLTGVVRHVDGWRSLTAQFRRVS